MPRTNSRSPNATATSIHEGKHQPSDIVEAARLIAAIDPIDLLEGERARRAYLALWFAVERYQIAAENERHVHEATAREALAVLQPTIPAAS